MGGRFGGAAAWQGAAEPPVSGKREGRGCRMLPAPTDVTATPGQAHTTLDWAPVDGAIGYLVHRADAGAGGAASAPPQPLDHRGGDVLAVPHPPYADTTGEPGRTYHYAVAALADTGDLGALSSTVAAAAVATGNPTVRVRVDAGRSLGPLPRPWRPMIGSEHLSHLLCRDTTGGRPIGAELGEALRMVGTELGVRSVRAHAILCDDLGVYQEVDGEPRYDFSRVDEVYDRVLGLGLRPVVELSFMPRDLAADPSKTVFAYAAVISPPKDWDRWADLVGSLVRHLVDRYGLDEVRHWPFEVWNEANLDVFWSGTQADYLRLYDVTARAVKDVHPDLTVGGPGSAAAGWVGDLLAHVKQSGAPVDFVSTHTYGSPPLDLRPLCARHGRPDLGILWTEWGATPTHFGSVNDDVFAAAFLLRGMRSAAGRMDALSHWVASDHFEELGRPPRLFHGGFGLLTIGNLRKPRYWALHLLEQLGREQVALSLDGDGAGSLVEAMAARDDGGRVGVLVWNGTLDQSKVAGHAPLARRVRLELTGLAESGYRLRHWRVDGEHSNVRAVWEELGGGDWPEEEQWRVLHSRNTLDAYEPERQLTAGDGAVPVELTLPMPAISYLELAPE